MVSVVEYVARGTPIKIRIEIYNFPILYGNNKFHQLRDPSVHIRSVCLARLLPSPSSRFVVVAADEQRHFGCVAAWPLNDVTGSLWRVG